MPMLRQVVEATYLIASQQWDVRLNCGHCCTVSKHNVQVGDRVDCMMCPSLEEAHDEEQAPSLAERLQAQMTQVPASVWGTMPPFVPLPELTMAVIELAERVAELEAKAEKKDA